MEVKKKLQEIDKESEDEEEEDEEDAQAEKISTLKTKKNERPVGALTRPRRVIA